MRILLIEDEKMLVAALREEFQRRKCTILTAADGEEGWRILSAYPVIDVIVLDLVLPKMDGFELLKKIKADKKLKIIPLVVLTNLSDDTTISAIVAAGGRDYLVKADYTLHEVAAKVLDIAKRSVFQKPKEPQSPIML
ncbi:MAG: response regulator [Patescibacteria group bacterium]